MKTLATLLLVGMLSLAPAWADTWTDATTAFKAGRTAAGNAATATSHAGTEASLGNTQAARAAADSAAREATEAIERIAEARAALDQGTINGEIGPEAGRLLERYLSELDFEAQQALLKARALQASLAAATTATAQPTLTSRPTSVPEPAARPAQPTQPAPTVAAAPDAVFPHGNPDPAALRQGRLGTCNFLAALVALAQQRPADVKKLIRTNGDGTYTVTFPGQSPVTVQEPTPEQRTRYADAGTNGLWAAILERAYGEWCKENSWIVTSDEAYDNAESGLPSKGLGLVTGHEIDTDILSFTTLSTTRKKLKQALADGRLVTADVAWVGMIGNGLGLTTLPDFHVYAVIGYDPDADVIKLRNPWGGEDQATGRGGVFTLPLTQFDSLFRYISYEEPAPATRIERGSSFGAPESGRAGPGLVNPSGSIGHPSACPGN